MELLNVRLLNLKCYVNKVNTEDKENHNYMAKLGLADENDKVTGNLIITNVLFDINDFSFLINTDEDNSCILVTKQGQTLMVADKDYLLDKLATLKLIL